MTARWRRRAGCGARPLLVAAALHVAAAASAPGQTSREASGAQLEQLVQRGAVEELEAALAGSTAPADMAALARAQANHASRVSDPAARHAAFEDAARRYERWIATLEKAPGRAPAILALELAEARAELGAMVLARWASRDLAEFELTGGRSTETARLAELLRRADEHYRAALAATDPLMQPLRAARPGVEEDYLALGIFDALGQVDMDARSNVAWLALYRARVAPGADAERLARLSESETLFRELDQRSLPPNAAARTRIGLGIALREMQRLDEAAATLAHSVHEAAGSALEAQARCELARVHLRAGRHAEARAVLRPVVESGQPAAAGGYSDLAQLLHAESLLVEADALERQAQDSPARGALLRKAERSRDEGLTALARIAERGGPWPQVVQTYVEQHARFDADPGTLSPGVLLLTAQALRARGDVPGARQHLDAGLARGEVPPPMRASLLLERARCEQAAGDVRAAANTLLGVSHDHGDDPRAQGALRDACRLLAAAAEESKRQDDYRQAADALWQLAQRYPQQGEIPDAQWWCAVAYQNAGDDASAAKAFAAVPTGSGNWEAAQFQRLAALRRIAAREAATQPADESKPRMRSIAEALEAYAAGALRRADEADGASPTRRFSGLARLEAARLWLDPMLNEPGRAEKLLADFDDWAGLPEARGEVPALRVRAAAALGRFGDALALLDSVQAAGGDALRDAVAAQLAQAIQREMQRLESAEAADALRRLAAESLPFFESLRESAVGGSNASHGVASRPAPNAVGLSRTLAKLYHHAGDSQSASRLIAELLKRDPRDGELMRLQALNLTAIAGQGGDAESVAAARRAWEPILADATLIERSPRTYWEARCHHLALLLREGQASVVRDAIRQERAWRPELGGEPWHSMLVSLLEQAEAQSGSGPVSSAPASRRAGRNSRAAACRILRDHPRFDERRQPGYYGGFAPRRVGQAAAWPWGGRAAGVPGGGEMSVFRIVSEFQPRGDQPQAIERLVSTFRGGAKFQTLLGVTGSGKTFTMAHVIAALGKPTLVLSHNKTLAAQLYEEFRELFPNNAVEYFVSYYDYYQPEAYIPQRDIYIEKDASRNDDLDRLRLSATSSVISRPDVVVVASVSCIFGLGSPDEYKASVVSVRKGDVVERDALLRKFVRLQYERSDTELQRATFRVRGDVVELYPAYEEYAIRIELFGDEVERISIVHPLTGGVIQEREHVYVYPAVHYVMPEENIQQAIESIEQELNERVAELRGQGKLLEAQRLLARTKYDMEMLLEVGYCSGIENYTRHLNRTTPGAKPYTLIDYFPRDFLLIIDESHVTVPQIGAMYGGDRSRKEVLVEHGFRLPSCLDNRPMRFEEFEAMWRQTLFVSATPGPYELEKCGGEVVEQIIRPTGLVDPVVEVRPARGQVPDLLQRIQERAAAGERSLVTTLTKRLAEDLSSYIQQSGLRGRYLHSEIETLERIEILRELRLGSFDVLVGVNLLREGLDLPEVSLVAILDADKEGFLRSETSLIQMIGRCARNVNATVYLYADRVTPSMQRAIHETNRRRELQLRYNAEHGITPDTVRKAIRAGLMSEVAAHRRVREAIRADEPEYDRDELLRELEAEMLQAAQELDFEKAAALRDHIAELKASPELKVAASAARPKAAASGRDQGGWRPKAQHRRARPRRR